MTDLDKELNAKRLDALKRIEGILLNLRAALTPHTNRYDVLIASAGTVEEQARLRWGIEIDKVEIGVHHITLRHGSTFQIVRIGSLDPRNVTARRKGERGIFVSSLPYSDREIMAELDKAQAEVTQAIAQATYIAEKGDILTVLCQNIRDIRESAEAQGMPRLDRDDAFLYRLFPELYGYLAPF